MYIIRVLGYIIRHGLSSRFFQNSRAYLNPPDPTGRGCQPGFLPQPRTGAVEGLGGCLQPRAHVKWSRAPDWGGSSAFRIENGKCVRDTEEDVR